MKCSFHLWLAVVCATAATGCIVRPLRPPPSPAAKVDAVPVRDISVQVRSFTASSSFNKAYDAHEAAELREVLADYLWADGAYRQVSAYGGPASATTLLVDARVETDRTLYLLILTDIMSWGTIGPWWGKATVTLDFTVSAPDGRQLLKYSDRAVADYSAIFFPAFRRAYVERAYARAYHDLFLRAAKATAQVTRLYSIEQQQLARARLAATPPAGTREETARSASETPVTEPGATAAVQVGTSSVESGIASPSGEAGASARELPLPPVPGAAGSAGSDVHPGSTAERASTSGADSQVDASSSLVLGPDARSGTRRPPRIWDASGPAVGNRPSSASEGVHEVDPDPWQLIREQPRSNAGPVVSALKLLGGVEASMFRGSARVSSQVTNEWGQKADVAAGDARQKGWRISLYSAPKRTGFVIYPVLGFMSQSIDIADFREALPKAAVVSGRDIDAVCSDPATGMLVDCTAPNVYSLAMQSGYGGLRAGYDIVGGTSHFVLFGSATVGLNLLEYRSIEARIASYRAKGTHFAYVSSGALGGTVGFKLPRLHTALRLIGDYELYRNFKYAEPLEFKGFVTYNPEKGVWERPRTKVNGAQLSAWNWQCALAFTF